MHPVQQVPIPGRGGGVERTTTATLSSLTPNDKGPVAQQENTAPTQSPTAPQPAD